MLRAASTTIIHILARPVVPATRCYLLLGPLASPFYRIAVDPVVRLASEAPIADGRVKRDRNAVEGQLPVRWTERRRNFVSAAAKAFVDGRAVLHSRVS